MALFGRRKPGFSKEVKLNPDEIPGEFSDALDPAVNRELDNPKAEKRILQENAEKVINGEKARPMAISRIFWIIWNLCRMSKIRSRRASRRKKPPLRKRPSVPGRFLPTTSAGAVPPRH